MHVTKGKKKKKNHMQDRSSLKLKAVGAEHYAACAAWRRLPPYTVPFRRAAMEPTAKLITFIGAGQDLTLRSHFEEERSTRNSVFSILEQDSAKFSKGLWDTVT